MTSHRFIYEYVLEKCAAESVPQRIAIYRHLADVVGNPAESASLDQLASDLQKIEADSREFNFRYRENHSLSV